VERARVREQAGPQYGVMPAVPPGRELEQARVQVAPKNPALAVVLSIFIPGLGSMVSGNGGIGALILCLNILGWTLSFFLVGVPLVIGSWIWGLVNAHSSAVRWNRQHGVIS
jgi:TM2 domain-containing membrane protein YozV